MNIGRVFSGAVADLTRGIARQGEKVEAVASKGANRLGQDALELSGKARELGSQGLQAVKEHPVQAALIAGTLYHERANIGSALDHALDAFKEHPVKVGIQLAANAETLGKVFNEAVEHPLLATGIAAFGLEHQGAILKMADKVSGEIAEHPLVDAGLTGMALLNLARKLNS